MSRLIWATAIFSLVVVYRVGELKVALLFPPVLDLLGV